LLQVLAALAIRDRLSPTIQAIGEAALARDAPEACRLLMEHYKHTADYLRLALEEAQWRPG
jgi:DNA-binding GntR family transcriptional regulator